jgi:hypothetical protein
MYIGEGEADLYSSITTGPLPPGEIEQSEHRELGGGGPLYIL